MGMRVEITVKSPLDTDRLAWHIASKAEPGDTFCLVGPLGAGKTRFAQALFKALGTTDYVRSPSFTLVNEYGGRMPLIHMDLYRLESPEDLADFGFDEYLGGDAVAVIEWADRAPGYLPAGHILVSFEMVAGEPQARRIVLESSSERGDTLLGEVSQNWQSLH